LSLERELVSAEEDPAAPPEQRCVTPDDSSEEGEEEQDDTSAAMNISPTTTTLDSYLELSRNLSGAPFDRTMDHHRTTPSSISSSYSSSSPLTGGGGYVPYLYTQPFAIPEDDENFFDSTSMRTTQTVSGQIVFNLGLIHQMVSRASTKAASFYEIAATLLSSVPEEEDDDEKVILIRLVLLNNFGVWCFENGEGESMLACFEQIMETLNSLSETARSTIDPAVRRGIQSNIQAFVTPMNGVSLAA
jgi:hypothetical protein